MLEANVIRGRYDTEIGQRKCPWSFCNVFAALMLILLAGLVASIVWKVVHNPCRKFFTINNLCIAIYIVATIWVAARASATQSEIFLHILIWMVAIFMFGSFIYAFVTIVVTGTGNGNSHEVTGLGYPEYYLTDKNSWLITQVSKKRNWKRYRRCIVSSGVCDELSKQYENLEDSTIWLTPIESGCCRPPSMCGYPAVNASFYDLNVKPAGQSTECKTYKNSRDIKCYDCDSCKAGVLYNIGTEVFLAVIWVPFLPFFLLVPCCCYAYYVRVVR